MKNIWTKWLFWCRQEKQDDLAKIGMKVTDLCDKGTTWSTYFLDKLCCPGFGCMATPFKAVTNILLLGRKTSVLINYCIIATFM